MKRSFKQHSAMDTERMSRLLAQKARTIRSRSAFKHQLYSKLFHSVHTVQPRSHERSHPIEALIHTFTWFVSAHRPIVAMLVVTVLGGSGLLTSYASASPQVTRESVLYPLKQAVENLQLSLASDPADRVETLLKFAEKRGNEAEFLSKSGVVDTPTVEGITSNIRKAVELTEQVQDDQQRESLRESIGETSRTERESLVSILSSFEESQEPPKTPFGPEKPLIDEAVTSAPAPTALKPSSLESLKKTTQELSNIENAAAQPESDTVLSGSAPTLLPSANTDRAQLPKKIQPQEEIVPPAPQPSPARSVRLLPDIVLSIVDPITFTTTQQGSVTVKLTNIGAGNAGPFTLTYDWGDGTTGTAEVDGIEIGEESLLKFTHAFSVQGQYFFRAVANSTRSIAESSETNNAMRSFINVLAGSSFTPAPASSSLSLVAPTTTVPTSSTCVDPDGGLQLFSRSVVTKGAMTLADECRGSALLEAYCDEDGAPARMEFDCPYGCSNGQCALAQ